MFQNIKTKNIVRMLYILLIFTLVTSVTFSRYMKTLTGEDTVSMATFTITSDITDAEGTIPFQLIQTDGETQAHYQLEVTNIDNGNLTKVDMDYELIFEVTNNLPITVELVKVEDPLQEDGYGTITPVADTENAYTITNATLTHEKVVSHIYDIYVYWDDDGDLDYKLSYEIDLITVTINAEQSLTAVGSSYTTN